MSAAAPATATGRRLRIAQVAPPLERVPPHGYGGTERVIDALVVELLRRGHEVTTFASGDSEVPGQLVPTVSRALRPAGSSVDPAWWIAATTRAVRRRARSFDLVHAHLETWGALLGADLPVPIVHTFHRRLDLPRFRAELPAMPGHLVAISASQARPHPDVAWAAIIHNGLALPGAMTDVARGPGLCFVGRITPEKGVVEAIAIAQRVGRPLRIAARAGTTPEERAYFEAVFQPALREAGRDVEYVGELAAADRDLLLASSFATLMPGGWPEPFGLVAIESLACGTPVVARAVGALPEIVIEPRDGFLGDDVQHLAFQVERCADPDRDAMRRAAIDRFSATRMADRYEALYRRVLGDDPTGPGVRSSSDDAVPRPHRP